MANQGIRDSRTPLDRIARVADEAASRIASAREANRARFPLLGQIVDRYPEGECKLVWAKDGHGEIGKRPAPDAWEMSGEAWTAMHQHYAAINRKGRR